MRKIGIAIKSIFIITKTNLFCIGYILLLIFCLWPSRFASRYEFVPPNKLFDVLVEKATKNMTLMKHPKCEYNHIIEENKFMYTTTYRSDILENSDIKLGGEYYPEDCTPLFSTAILVPYRQREKQLSQFLVYIHNFLRKQNIHYRIFVIEQFDQKPFNRAKLFNIAFTYASKLDFPCVILHDVDLMPMNLGHIYACSNQPRHMCASLDKFRFNLPYRALFGGAVAIETQIFASINGMSNMFHGWGGEDDDLFGRLNAKDIDICRFPPAFSQYTMLSHKDEKKNADRIAYLRNGSLRYHSDGLNSLIFVEKEFKMHNLFTHILVET